MIQRLRFYFRYALRNIQRGGRWTTLAILCITAGVATVVALRSMGLAIGDTLTGSIRVETKGDMLILNDRLLTQFGDNEPMPFQPAELSELLAWADAKGAATSTFMSGRNIQIAKTDAEQFGRPSFIGSYFIDPQTYPPTHAIRALDPPDAPLAELLTGANDVVISDNLASQSGIEVGDSVRVTGTRELYTVRGIVSAAEETSVTSLLNAFFGFAYFDLAHAQAVMNDEFAPNRIGVLFPDAVGEDQMLAYIDEVAQIAPAARTTTTVDLLQRYSLVAQYLRDFIVVMGLGALLIGGVGIMNTMLVLVRRRTSEIAAVKTFGVKASQVAALFFTEALMLGFIGSVLGLIAGIGLSVIVNEYGSVALRQQLVWQIYPEALLFGFTLGMVVTGIFGVAPILTAVRVRPNIILRPNENHLAALGILQSIALLVFVTISLGLIVGHIVRPSFELTNSRLSGGQAVLFSSATLDDVDGDDEGRQQDMQQNAQTPASLPSPYLLGVIGVAVTFLIFAVIIAILWLIVFIIGRLPSFGSVTLRLALRNLSTNRLRTATTLLALIAGMLALSSIAFVGEGTRELLNIQLNRSFGGNVLVFPLPGIPQAVVKAALDNALRDVDLEYRTVISNYTADLHRVGDEPVEISFSVWDSDNPDIYSAQGTLYAGRMLRPEDRGQPLVTLPLATAQDLGIEVGSHITIALSRAGEMQLEVVGITNASDNWFSGSNGLIPPEVIPAAAPSTVTMYSYQVPDEGLNQALTELSTIILAFSIDVSFLDGLLSRLINQFAAIPTIVGLLSLFAAAVIMANTVALATLERRRQIGILKAIGLKSGRVLRVMFIESGLTGLLSAGIGIGLSALLIGLLSAAGGIAIPLPNDARMMALALLAAALLIGWTATFLSARVAIKERVMNVLRYD